LYVDLVFERRALLFDLGDISAIPPRKLLRLAHVFITHRHMDHFIGFDQLLRCLLGRDKTLDIWGPQGLIDAVENKIKAYSWNLVAGYEGNFKLRASELGHDNHIRSAEFSGANSFRREELLSIRCKNGLLVNDPGFKVRAAIVEHGIPVLAFAVEERARINIWRNQVEAMGLTVGPWLGIFKEAIQNGAADDTQIPVVWADDSKRQPNHVSLGQLRSQIMKITKGRKIGYVVDAAFTPQNTEAIVSLVKDADVLFIEAPFLDEDAAHAAARNHLTARQAGMLAAWAKVKHLRTFHYSPRYHDREHDLAEEAQAALLAHREATQA
jgi:ribonuclease Z